MAPDTTPSLGEFLRQERERRGITIEQVASATKIGVRLLHSLEGDQYAELPAKPFVRGFVNSYCRFIGLDSKEVLTRFGDFIEQHAHDRPNREGGHSGYAFEKTGADRSRVYLGAFMGGFVALAGVAFVVLKPSLHHHHGSHLDKLKSAHASPTPEPSTRPSEGAPSPAPSAILPSAAPAPAPAPAATPAAAPSSVSTPASTPTATATPEPEKTQAPSDESAAHEAEPPDPLNSGVNLKGAEIKYKVVIRAIESVWVRYRVDERQMMKFILRKDKVLVLRATDLIRFQASDPSAVKFSLNGQAYRILSEYKNAVPRQGDLTLIVPHEMAEKAAEPFPGEKPMTGRSVPQPRTPEPLSTPGQ